MMASKFWVQVVAHKPFIIGTVHYPNDDQRVVVLVFADQKKLVSALEGDKREV